MRKHFRSYRALLTGVIACLCLTACPSAPKVRVDQDKRANFAAFKTFGWLEHKPAQGAGQISTIAGQRVHSAVMSAMQSKGYSFDDARPDVRVSYDLHVFERPKESGMHIGIGMGGGSGNMAGGVGVSAPVGKRTESVAAMTVDVIDASQNTQVWTGAFETLIKGKDATDEEVKLLVDAILAKYPSSGK